MRTLLPILLLLPATALAQDPPGAGDVVIAELMSKPGDGPEWFEVLNVANGALTLQGCVIGDESTATHEIAGEVVIQPGERALVAKGEMPDGCPPADYQYGSPALNDGGDTLTLSCPPDTEGDPVASLSYGNDQQAAPREGRSLFVCEESLEGDALEVREGFDPGCGGWMATPGAENEACPAPPPYPLAGQVVVNEVAVRAGSAETPEWVELKGTAAGEFNLDGCAFLDTKKDGSDGDRLDLRDRLTIQGGQRIVLASKDFPEGCDVIGVFDLGRVDIPTTYSVTVRLECPGADGSPVVVDSLDVDWKGLSDTDTLQRDPGDSGNVCLAPADAATCEATGGTPGAANGACPPPPPPPAPYPGVGGVVITEVIPSPDGTAEWFEVFNPAGSPSVNIAGCQVSEEGPVEELVKGCPEGGRCVPHHDVLEGGSINIEPGAYLVLAKSDCSGFEEVACATYGKLSFNGDVAEDLWITCPAAPGEEPTVEIDRVTYDQKGTVTELPLRKGESQAMHPECVKADGAATNDSMDCWCASTGTPGLPNECGDETSGGGGPKFDRSGCDCQLGGTGAPGLLAVPLLLLAALRRRRR